MKLTNIDIFKKVVKYSKSMPKSLFMDDFLSTFNNKTQINKIYKPYATDLYNSDKYFHKANYNKKKLIDIIVKFMIGQKFMIIKNNKLIINEPKLRAFENKYKTR